jgi:hypothetical protein
LQHAKDSYAGYLITQPNAARSWCARLVAVPPAMGHGRSGYREDGWPCPSQAVNFDAFSEVTIPAAGRWVAAAWFPEFPGGSRAALIAIRTARRLSCVLVSTLGTAQVMVVGRSSMPIGEVAALKSGGELDFVIRQLDFYWRRLCSSHASPR